MFGVTFTQAQAVTNAWYAVGIGAAYGSPTPPTSTAYCTSKGSSVAYEWIDYVKLGTGIARTSSADGGYYDGTASSSTLAAGSSQTIGYSAGFASSAYTEYWKIYIDYNQDGDFTDAGETVGSTSSASAATLSTNFTVPTTAKNGPTRLRVVMNYSSSATSCGSYSYGETEDYSVNITGGAAIAATTQGLTASAVNGDATLSLYPNPANSLVQLALSSGAELTKVEVMDLRGAAVPAARYQGAGQLDVSSLAAGLYLLRATDGERTYVQRFMKE